MTASPVLALLCAATHPTTGYLCRRPRGHAGVHAADPGPAWDVCPPLCPHPDDLSRPEETP